MYNSKDKNKCIIQQEDGYAVSCATHAIMWIETEQVEECPTAFEIEGAYIEGRCDERALIVKVGRHASRTDWAPTTSLPAFIEAIEAGKHLEDGDDSGPVTRDQRQKKVAEWCAAAFGKEHATNVEQRSIRLLEEAIEAVQAAGGSEEMAHKLVSYVFSRPTGELSQELGGIGVTLLALAEAAGLSAENEERREVARVLSKSLEHFAKRNDAKNEAGFNVTGKDGA